MIQNILNFLKGHKKKVILIGSVLFIVLIGIPLLINCSFKVIPVFSVFRAEWKAADVLNYYGDILTFLSTTVLSLLALWQNQVIRKANDQHSALLEKMERERNAPRIVVSDAVCLGNISNVSIVIKNVSENIALDVIISNFVIRDYNDYISYSDPNRYLFSCIIPGEQKKVDFGNRKGHEVESRISFQVIYKDKFDVSHKCKAIGYFSNSSKKLYFEMTEVISASGGNNV